MTQNSSVSFHPSRKATLLTVVIFIFGSILVNLFAAISTVDHFARFFTLQQSKYAYSAILRESVYQDDYYQINAEIDFSLSPDSQTCLNAAVLMQSAGSLYTDRVCWNAVELSGYGLAISEGIARKNHLELGDTLFAKHTVDGTTYAYCVEQVLPDVRDIRKQSGRGHTDGLIIMGYDSRYIENISHSVIFFADEDLNTVSDRPSDMPQNIVYRSDEMSFVAKALIPYLLIFTLAAVILSVGLSFFLFKNVMANYRRLIALGFEKKMTIRTFHRFVYMNGAAATVLSFGISASVLVVTGTLRHGIVILSWLSMVELCLMLTASVFERRLWR